MRVAAAGLSAHALSGSYHTGALTDTQHAARTIASGHRLTDLLLNTNAIGFANIVLTNAQILNCFTAPVLFVAAPGVGKIIVPISIWPEIDTLAAAYVGMANGLRLTHDAANPGTSVMVVLSGADMGSAEQRDYVQALATGQLRSNTALYLGTTGANPTGGNVANTVTVNMLYTVQNGNF